MARDDPSWGYKRLQGELAKVGITISVTSIRRVLAKPHRPRPHQQTWSQFMRALLKRPDRASIFLLIAGTYTPV
jgi:putative transposase